MRNLEEGLRELGKIQAKLEEAREIASIAGFEPDPTSREAGSPSVYPATVTILVDEAIEQCKNATNTLQRQIEQG